MTWARAPTFCPLPAHRLKFLALSFDVNPQKARRKLLITVRWHR